MASSTEKSMASSPVQDEPYLASQQMGDANDYTPTDEEMRELHYDGGLWSEPEDQGANFDRWLAAHDARIREELTVR